MIKINVLSRFLFDFNLFYIIVNLLQKEIKTERIFPMVRSSDIIRKDEELRQKKTDSTSDFLRLSDIFKLGGGESSIIEQNVQPVTTDIHSVYDIYSLRAFE